MTRTLLLALALILTACAGAPTQSFGVAPTLAPVYALQDAQATGTAAARAIDATATAQVNIIATEARASIALAEQQTQAAIPGAQTATAIANNVLVATATEGASHIATQISADLKEREATRERQEFESNVWIVIGFVMLGAITFFICRVIINIGRAYEAKVKAASIVIIRNGDSPVGYFLPGSVPTYHSLTGGYAKLVEGEPDPERQCREAWREAVKAVARDAANAGSWGVNTLSTRGGGKWTEDTVQRVQAIAAEVRAIVNYGGQRGFDWAPDWNYIDFSNAIDNGVYFTLPRKAPLSEGENGQLLWPVLPEQSKAQQRKAKPSKASAAVP